VAALEKLLAGARPDERAQAAARLHEAETELELRQAEDARRRSLRNTGSVSPEEADRARSVRGMAEARRNAAQSALNLINSPPRREDVDIARAELALAQARLAQSQASYDRTVIRAPLDGVVLRRFRQAGEAVGNLPPSPILRIGDVGRLRVRAEVDEADLARLALGQRVYIKADAYGQRQFGGSVVRIAPELGRKLVFAGRPTDKLDADVLDAVIELDPDVRLPVGLRVDVFFQRSQFPAGQN
jgi:HlyD family secretion protein